jgi:hypothetical protein
MVQGMGGIVAPLLAGFSLATIGVLVTTGWVNASRPSSDGPPHADLAIATLAIAAAMFILTMEFAFIGARYVTTPEERMSWTAEATVHEQALAAAREEQAMDRHLADFYSARAGWLYNGGILAFLAGLGALIIPQRWTFWFLVAVVIVLVALVFEAWSALVRWPNRWYAAIFPFYKDVRAKIAPTIDALDEASRDAVMRRPGDG